MFTSVASLYSEEEASRYVINFFLLYFEGYKRKRLFYRVESVLMSVNNKCRRAARILNFSATTRESPDYFMNVFISGLGGLLQRMSVKKGA